MPVQEQERVIVAPDPWRARSAAPSRRAPQSPSLVEVSVDPAQGSGARQHPVPGPDRRPDRARDPVERGAHPDLEVRLHAPLPQAVIVRVAGAVDRLGAVLLAQRVGQQLRRFGHVVLDLGEVAALSSEGVAVLIELHHAAVALGANLHVVGTDHDAVRGPLAAAGADRLLVRALCADAVIALLHPQGHGVPAARSSGGRPAGALDLIPH